MIENLTNNIDEAEASAKLGAVSEQPPLLVEPSELGRGRVKVIAKMACQAKAVSLALTGPIELLNALTA